jgi:hypothetical protein
LLRRLAQGLPADQRKIKEKKRQLFENVSLPPPYFFHIGNKPKRPSVRNYTRWAQPSF